MIESLFVLVIIFVAYVLYSRANQPQKMDLSEEPAQSPVKSVPAQSVQATVVNQDATVASKPKPKPKPKPKAIVETEVPLVPAAPAVSTTAAKKSPVKPAASPKVVAPKVAKQDKPAVVKNAPPSAAPVTSMGKVSLKNPSTGEIAAPFSNYRFTKRWIKEALVSEGLLDKIYKNNELDDAVEEKIKTAVTQLEAMSNYQA